MRGETSRRLGSRLITRPYHLGTVFASAGTLKLFFSKSRKTPSTSNISASNVRLIATSTVCREEQQPYCRVTFFASSSLPSPPLPVLYLIVPIAVGLPYIIFRFLSLTNSATSLARFHLPLVLAPALINGTCFWIIEWVDAAGLLGNESTTDLKESRTLMAWFSMTWVACLGGVGWCWWPVCFEIVSGSVKTRTSGEKARSESNATINAFGAPYLIFWTIFFAVVYVCTQLTGQAVLALSAIALLSFLELLDSTRHAKALGSAKFASEVLERYQCDHIPSSHFNLRTSSPSRS